MLRVLLCPWASFVRSNVYRLSWGNVSSIILLADSVSGARRSLSTLDQMCPTAQKVGAISAEIFDEEGTYIPALAVSGAFVDGG